MNAIVLLFLVGLVFLGFEVFVPGAVMGIIGGLAMLAGCAVAFDRYGVAGGSLALAAAVLLIGITLYVEFFLLPKTRVGKRMFLNSSVAGTSQPLPADPAVVVGKTAEALSVLAPTGYVLVDGKKYEASSQDGLIEKGQTLRVTGLDRFTLKVTKL